MSNLAEVVFKLEPRPKRGGDVPRGVVKGMIVPGHGRSGARFLSGLVEYTTVLDEEVACRMLEFRSRYLDKLSWTRRAQETYNCLGFMAFGAFGRPIGPAELCEVGPSLVEGKYKLVDPLESLTPGGAYGFPDSHDRLVHGCIALPGSNVSVGVDEMYGDMVIEANNNLVYDYLLAGWHPGRMVELQPDSYIINE